MPCPYFADDIFDKLHKMESFSPSNCTKWKVFRPQTAQNGKFLEACVDDLAWEDALDVEEDVLRLEQRWNVETAELVVGYGKYGGIEFGLWELGQHFDAILVARDVGICPWVVDGDVDAVLAQGAHNVDDFGVAHVGTVLFKREAEHEDIGIEH